MLIHLFVGNILSEQNNKTILEKIDSKHELAAGEFIHILTKLNDNDLDLLKSPAGAALRINQDTGKATSFFYQSDNDIKEYVIDLRFQGAVQIS